MKEELNFIKKTKERIPVTHLIPGINPIVACVGTPEDFSDTDFSPFHEAEEVLFPDNRKISFAVSSINGKDKSSGGFVQCTGLIVAGKDKSTGENISFLTHQDPYDFLSENRESFENLLREKLLEISERCVPGTIDAVIVGGDYFSSHNFRRQDRIRKMYIRSIEFIGTTTRKVLGFEPTVINGPQSQEAHISDHVTYNNTHRRVYFQREKVNSEVGDFVPSQVDENIK